MNAKFSSVKKFSYIQIILFSLGFSVVLFILSSHFTQPHLAKVCTFKMFLLHLIIEIFSYTKNILDNLIRFTNFKYRFRNILPFLAEI